MAQPAAKQRRRIQPQLIVSPGADDRRAQLEEAGAGNEPAGPILLQKQREQSEWAREHLGPDRKVFLDLTDVAANKEVDWRKVLKERGVQKPSKAAAEPADAAGASDDPLLLRGRNGRQENMNTWTRMLAKLEATYCVGAGSDEESESDGWGDDSDSDAEEEGGEGGASKEEGEGAAGDGNTTGGEGGGGGKDGGKGGKKRERGAGGDYDYFDDFIDDEEFLELLEHDKRKPKHTGFFISKGEIERTEEMLPGFEELGKAKKGGKRKAEEDAGATDGEGAAAAAKEGKPAGEKKKRKAEEGGVEAGAVSEGDKPAKKKKKIVAEPVAGSGTAAAAAPAGGAAPAAPAAAPGGLSVAQLARMAGQMAAAGVAPTAADAAAEAGEAAEPDGSQLSSPLRQQTQQAAQAPTSAKKKGPYEMPAAVRGAIEDIRRVAEREEAPLPPAPGDKPKKRRVPRAVGDAIDAFSPLFLQQEAEWGRTATNRILEALEFLVPFIAKASLSQRLRNKEKPEKKSAAPAGAGTAGAAGAAAGAPAAAAAPKVPKKVSPEQLRELISAKVEAKPFTSDDDFEPKPPRASTSPPTQATQAGDASGAAPATSSAPAKPQAWKALDRAVKDQVFLYIKQRMQAEDKAPKTTLLQEIYQFFPPNSIAPDDLKEIWKAGRAKERRAEKAAAAAAGQPAQAAGGEGATQQQQQAQQVQQQQAQQQGTAQQAPVQQQQEQQQQQQQQQQGAAQQAPVHQQQQAQPGEAVSPEALAFANLAVAAAEHKVGSPPPPQQQQQQGAALSPAAVAAALAAQAGGEQAAAAGGSPTPSPQAATTQLASPVAMQPPSQAGTTAAGEAGEGQARQPPAFTDAELVAKVKAWGGNEEAAWAALDLAKPSVYALAYTRVLMHVGPGGMGATEAARLAHKLNLGDKEMKQGTTCSTSFSKMASQKEWFVHVGKGKYALQFLPGVVEVVKIKLAKGDKKSGKGSEAASAAEGSAAAGGEEEEAHEEAEGSVDEEMGDATEEAEVEDEAQPAAEQGAE